MDLYRDHLPEQDDEFKKESAYAARLGEEPENWPQELSSELLKQLPFLSDYELNVNLDRVDTGRGFAFGYADIANRTERPEVEHEEHGLPHIRVPIVVQEKSVKPFSTYLDGDAVLPLTEERVREALFNPNSFDISQTLPRDPSLVEPLMPPTRSGAGYGGEYKMASVDLTASFTKVAAESHSTVARGAKQDIDFGKGNVVKKGQDIELLPYDHKMQAVPVRLPSGKVIFIGSKLEKKASLLRAIAPTMRESDVSAFKQKLASDPTLRAGFKRAGVVNDLIEVFDKTKRASAGDRLSFIAAGSADSGDVLQAPQW
jgi:hypothetical protein